MTTVPSSLSARVSPSASATIRRWRIEEFYPAFSGLFLAVSFAPFDLSFLSFIALVPLLLYVDKATTTAQLVRGGAVTAALFFGIVESWLLAVGGFSLLIIPGFLVILFCSICNFFVFILAAVLGKRYLGLPYIATAPFGWVLTEHLRALGDVAFPWTPIGYSLAAVPFFAQFADVVGIYGVSFYLVALNVLLFEIIRRFRSRSAYRPWLVAWLLVFGTVNLYNGVRWFGVRDGSSSINVAVIQPNVAQRIKWDDRYGREILRRTFALHQTAVASRPDLVAWPETAIPYYIDERKPFALGEMGQLPPTNSYVVTGLLKTDVAPDGRALFYNAASLFDPRGTMLETYRKIYLVPGSERYPFRNIIGFTRAFFSIQRITYGAIESGKDRTVFSIPNARFSVLICYESAFPQLSREFRLAGSQFLVNVTNDAWFGRSFAAYQHAAFLALRAIENRTAVVRSANTGISGFIDSRGRWLQKSDLFVETLASERIPLAEGLTFYTRFGDWIVYLSYAVIGAFAGLAILKKYRILPLRLWRSK